MAQFTVQITLGNDAMQTPDDIAAVLDEVVRRITRRGDRYAPATPGEGPIIDDNGNRVGVWRVTA